MERMGLSKRRATKGVKTLPDDFEKIKQAYINRVKSVVEEESIPPEMIVNWDQTGVNFVPCGNWTMAETGKCNYRSFDFLPFSTILVLWWCQIYVIFANQRLYDLLRSQRSGVNR
jgi:hypothetical protein